MEIFKNKFLVKLIASICLFLTLLNFGSANKVYAEEEVWGGVLIKPITNLMTALGDGIMDILHKAVKDQDQTLIKIKGDADWWVVVKTIIAVLAVIVAAVAFVVAASATAGLANAAIAVLAGEAFSFSMGAVTSGMLLGGIAVGACVGIRIGNAWFPNDIYLPVYTISAEEIFSNSIYLFDVDFFNIEDNNYTVEKEVENTYNFPQNEHLINSTTQLTKTDDPNSLIKYNNIGNAIWSCVGAGDHTLYSCINNDILRQLLKQINSTVGHQIIPTSDENDDFYEYTVGCDGQGTFQDYRLATDADGKQVITSDIVTITDSNMTINKDGERICYITYKSTYCYIGEEYTYEVSEYFNVEFDGGDEITLVETATVPIKSTAEQLQRIVSTWYFILRNVALLVLMLILIYSGIRIVIGSTAGEKAKYKERLMDWLVALCLVMVMHYIMVFAVNIVNQITDLVATTTNNNAAYIPLTNEQWEHAKKMEWGGFGVTSPVEDNFVDGVNGIFVKEKDNSEGSGIAIVWQTDLAGLFRLQSQLENEGTAKWVGYSLCFVILVLFTLFFAFTYAKRVIYMAFLTIIAPLVAMTYPIDKITDGKAQAFDSWLKEYIFNLMIQPLHLLLYTILVTSVFQLASTNAIYALCAIGFMMPAEKLVRRFFGFEKAKTPGLLGGAAGAAIAMSGLQNLMKPKHHQKNGDSSNIKTKDQNKVNYANRNKVDTLGAVMAGDTPTGNSTPQNNSSRSPGGLTPRNGNNDNNGTKEWNDDEIDEAMGNMAFAEDWSPDDVGNGSTINSTDETTNGGDEDGIDDIFTDTSNEAETDQTTESKRSIKRAVGAVAKGIGRDIAVGALKGINPLRLAGRVAAGATVGTAGLLLGIASGDPNKAFQYTTAGAVAGSALASSLSGSKVGDQERLKEETEMAYYGEDYKKHQIEKQIRAFQRDRANINYIRQTMGKTEEEAKEILATTGEKCFNNGITKVEDIATIHKLTTGRNSMSFNQAVAAREYATKRLPSDTDKMEPKTIDQHKKRWAKEFRDKNKDLSEEQAKGYADKAFDWAIRYNKAQSSLTKMP